MSASPSPAVRRIASVALVVAGLVVLYWYFWGRGGDDDPPRLGLFVEAEMIQIPRDSESDFVVEDRDLVSTLSGSLEVPGELVEAASCVAGADWLWDRVLTPDIVVSTDPALVRAAELYAAAIEAGDLGRARIVAQTEQQYWRVGAELAELERWAAGIGTEQERRETLEYLAARAEAPSADAQRRFVVYVVKGNVWVQRIYYLDGARLEPARLDASSSEAVDSDRLIAGEDEPVSFPLRACDDVARSWDLYDPELPDLPPIEDRWEIETGRAGQSA